MELRRRTRRRIKIAAIAAAAAAVFAIAGFAIVAALGDRTPPPVSEKVAAYLANPPTPSAGQRVSNVPIAFTKGTKTVFFGDSWTSGLYMKPAQKGYAYLVADQLGLDAEVIGGNGTGYLNAGPTNLGGYGQRLSALPVSDAKLLIMQGSVNDFGRNSADLGPAFDDTLKIAKGKFPQAQIVILGPSTAQWPVQQSIVPIDDILAGRAQNAGLAYISPYMGRWINADNFSKMIDPATGHPSEAGHAYFASKVVEALKAKQAK